MQSLQKLILVEGIEGRSIKIARRRRCLNAPVGQPIRTARHSGIITGLLYTNYAFTLGLPAVDTCVALKGCRTIRNETAVTSAVRCCQCFSQRGDVR